MHLLWPFDARRHTLTHDVPCLQMSSEDNSNRLDSGNIFDGDYPSPSSPPGPEISWTESSQNNSASQGREIAKEGEHGNEEAIFSENE